MDAKVICRMLGFDPTNSVATVRSAFGEVSSNFILGSQFLFFDRNKQVLYKPTSSGDGKGWTVPQKHKVHLRRVKEIRWSQDLTF